jgi:hypothetical protein
MEFTEELAAIEDAAQYFLRRLKAAGEHAERLRVLSGRAEIGSLKYEAQQLQLEFNDMDNAMSEIREQVGKL